MSADSYKNHTIRESVFFFLFGAETIKKDFSANLKEGVKAMVLVTLVPLRLYMVPTIFNKFFFFSVYDAVSCLTLTKLVSLDSSCDIF